MRAFEQRKKDTSNNSSFFSPKIQKKLKTGTPGDQFEVEADKVADKVVNNNSSSGLLQSKSEEEVQQKPVSETISSVQSKEMKEEEPVQKKSDEKEEKVQKKEEKKEEEPVQKKTEEKEEAVQKKTEEKEEPVQKKEEKEEPIQAKCADCEKEEKVQKKDNEEEKPVQKKEQNSKKEGQENDLEDKLNNSKGGGTGLDKKTKNEMESGFGADFSDVKVHTDSNAVQMSQELGAQAFTNGNDVYFNKGKYNPNSKEGKHLLAHELTHTIQQTGMVQKSMVGNDYENGSENLEAPRFQGNSILEQVHDNQRLVGNGQSGPCVSKIQAGLEDLGFTLPQYGADGIFGNETKQAVLDFQDTYDLAYDGIVGGETMGLLDDIHVGKQGGGGKKDKKKPKKCSKKKPVVVKSGTFPSQMSTKFFTESGCKNDIIIKSRDLHDNSDVGGCNAFEIVVDGINRGTVNPKFGKDTKTVVSIPGISIGMHEITLTVPSYCNAIIKATISVF